MASQDAVLLLGNEDEKLKRFLSRLGYRIFGCSGETPLPNVLASQSVDIIVIDARTDLDCGSLCDFLRTDDTTKRVPILFLGEQSAQIQKLKEEGYEKIDYLEGPISPGLVMSRLATLLRVGKISGLGERNASIAEVLAAQRDLNDKIKRELEQARHIQQSLLPVELPRDERFEIVATYRPLEEVGGDVYFVALQLDGRLLVHVADVTGHGMSAALIGSMTRLAFAAAPTSTAAEHLSGMNRLLTPLLPTGTFVTAESFYYNPSTNVAECARAGHPPYLYVSKAEKKVTRILPDGFPIGLLEDNDYAAAQVTLQAGDSLVLFTDGLTEAQNRSFECYGESRLNGSIVRAAECASAEEMLANIMGDFEDFIDGRRLKDDVTLLVLRRRK